MKKLFVSHRTCDMALAERLANDLRALGYDVWLDKWEIGLGDSITGKMDDGLDSSTHIVLCYSSAGVMSAWMSREWLSALARQLNGAGIRVLPVVLSGGQPPAILADIKHADLSTDWNNGVQAIVAAVGPP